MKGLIRTIRSDAMSAICAFGLSVFLTVAVQADGTVGLTEQNTELRGWDFGGGAGAADTQGWDFGGGAGAADTQGWDFGGGAGAADTQGWDFGGGAGAADTQGWDFGGGAGAADTQGWDFGGGAGAADTQGWDFGGGAGAADTQGWDFGGGAGAADTQGWDFDGGSIAVAKFPAVGSEEADGRSYSGELLFAGPIAGIDYVSNKVTVMGEELALEVGMISELQVGDYIGVVGVMDQTGAVQIEAVGEYIEAYTMGYSLVVSSYIEEPSRSEKWAALVRGTVAKSTVVTVYGTEAAYGGEINTAFVVVSSIEGG